MSAIIDKLRAMIAKGARLSELIDAAEADGWVLSLRMSANAPGSSGHSITAHIHDENTGEERVESASL